ncbi:hypothetical protein HYG86_02965 [Alkalicella caledoniensis]|uniref:Dihydrofolate synthase / folylpolyglutamate synthase n=1 Tax=Alkalicella caledoniensis TaxID=2731377 RepID=A0A7G9W533_ALKCA|nr:hypothetical protein [Alkalicella caledoniensis]QNO13795.1 hypothetical protein HYG86_02965 [Alkalicella caledoniensis]
MNIKEAIDYVYSYWNTFGKNVPFDMHDKEFRDPDLTRRLIEDYGVKIDRDKNILVVGSKGKGTTATLLAEILTTHGYKVGLFTSPHLERFTERIKIDGLEIPESTMAQYIQGLIPHGENVTKEIVPPYYLGPNGIFLAAALKYFQDNKTDFNVLESGRGGRYDDVYKLGNNVILTPIVLEHKYRLGTTLPEVVQTKHSIIDLDTKHVVVSKQSESVEKTLSELEYDHVKYFYYNQDHFLYEHRINEGQSIFNINIHGEKYKARVPNLVEYIGLNLSSALSMAKIILGEIQQSKLESLSKTTFSGRCEILSTSPLVVLDGMICGESAKLVLDSLPKTDNGGRKVAILAIPSDKDYMGVIKVLITGFDHIIFTRSIGAQYPFPTDLPQIVSNYNNEFSFTNSLDEAIEIAKEGELELVGVFGTQSLIGEARRKRKNIQKTFDKIK